MTSREKRALARFVRAVVAGAVVAAVTQLAAGQMPDWRTLAFAAGTGALLAADKWLRGTG